MTEEKKKSIIEKVKIYAKGVFQPSNALQLILLTWMLLKGGYKVGDGVYTEWRSAVDTVRVITPALRQMQLDYATYKIDQMAIHDSIKYQQKRKDDSIISDIKMYIAKQQ